MLESFFFGGKKIDSEKSAGNFIRVESTVDDLKVNPIIEESNRMIQSPRSLFTGHFSADEYFSNVPRNRVGFLDGKKNDPLVAKMKGRETEMLIIYFTSNITSSFSE